MSEASTPDDDPAPPDRGLLRLEIEVPAPDADAAAAIPWRLGAQGVALRDGADAPPGRAVICAWLPAADGERLRREAAEWLGPLADRAEIRLIAEDPRRWQGQLAAPTTVGGFVLMPDFEPEGSPLDAAERRDPVTGRHRLLIEPGSAFGDGAHPTTALCIEAVEALLAAAQAPAVLDVGTGTGVLALVAATLGAAVVGTDIDPLARRAAARHARRNGLAERVRICAEPPAAAFDLVVANLYLDPLIALAPTLAARVAPGGRCLVSGIAVRHRGRVERVFGAAGLVPQAAAERDGWLALTFVRPPDRPGPSGDVEPAEASV